MRDAIVLSYWTWDRWGSPERIAVILAQLGARVLHCEGPVSMFRHGTSADLRDVAPGVTTCRPRIVSARLHGVPGAGRRQAAAVAGQIVRSAARLGLRQPIVFYGVMGGLLPVCADLRGRGLPLVFLGLDTPIPHEDEHVAMADVALIIPRLAYHRFRARYGERVARVPQMFDGATLLRGPAGPGEDPPGLRDIPRPRLGYLGVPARRLNAPLLRTVLERRPDWHFVAAEKPPGLDLPNVHAVGWITDKEDLARHVAGIDVGFLPYDLWDPVQLNCVPLKLYEYFGAGLPVVATPFVAAWEHAYILYSGETAAEIEAAVEAALEEPATSPKRQRRMDVARQHTFERFAEVLTGALAPLLETPGPVGRGAT